MHIYVALHESNTSMNILLVVSQGMTQGFCAPATIATWIRGMRGAKSVLVLAYIAQDVGALAYDHPLSDSVVC